MLPAAHRLTDGRSFRSVIRDGRRAGSRTLVLHLSTPTGLPDSRRPDSRRPDPRRPDPRRPDPRRPDAPPRVGLVVGRAVGNSVVRHRVQRRLRHLVRERLPLLPASARLVVRATPAAATASSRELGADLARCLQRVMS